ncbi:MAG: dihydrofolate reductase [Halobacteriovoraceae bacterium]|jgi:dihydrofolate reductase|nr:dihydrofolate reductase [Halobacteriovoraceae bacterium]MBT5092815.1 dihydrofolate reductase [Halobacteriovoraceae bacterium]
MDISLIVAMGNNREIGKDNSLLWHIKEDFKNFKKVTMGHHMVMGRKTFESIGKALPGRTTIILTRDKSYEQADCLVAHSKEEAIVLASQRGESELFICGGREIYELFMPLADKLYLSKVDFEGEADTYFPKFEESPWNMLEERIYCKNELAPAWRYQVLTK